MSGNETRALNVVWFMFDEPHFTVARLIEAARDFAPDLTREEVAHAVVAQVQRGRLTVSPDGFVVLAPKED